MHRATKWNGGSNPIAGFLGSALAAAFGRNGYYIAATWMLAERGYGSAGVAVLLAIVSVVEFLASPLAGAAADLVPDKKATRKTHIVKRGDNLWQIARDYSVDVSQLQRWNHLGSRTLKPGQTLTVSAPN